MKAKVKDWVSATENLQKRRENYGHTNDNVHTPSNVSDYKSHIEKCGYGESVLDVGCGSQYLKTCLPDNVKYIGLDAFPIDGIDCIHCAIEDLKGWEVDTVVAYAVLDNCRDFFEACESMKKAARKNVSILTGIGIEVDDYHTFKLELSDFSQAFEGWSLTHKEQLQPKVWLLNYTKP
jgi:hypothetical protein